MAVLGMYACLLLLAVSPSVQADRQRASRHQVLEALLESEGHLEIPGDPPVARGDIAALATSPPAAVVRGSFESVQVNVDAAGNNLLGDAANEPSIAVDPTNPARIVIGWRQFDSVASDFRQAGWAYSHDAGLTWTFPGVLEPGVFRSDPVLGADADGDFYYYSLWSPAPEQFACDLFKSTDGGITWGDPVFGFGGDKAWMAIDRTEGVGRGHI